MVDQGPRKPPTIPSWQQSWQAGVIESSSSNPDQPSVEQDTTPHSTLVSPTIEEAEELLKDDSVREGSREEKVALLQKKGVNADTIETLLGPEPSSSSSSSGDIAELKTVHDTSQIPNQIQQPTPSQEPLQTSTSPSSQPVPTASSPRRDIPPIITYPEFLLKPQKPPPLVTVERLTNAAYVLAGISALTWGTSKYLIQPMLETLTEARHSLAETTKSDLETLNKKLEATVSHVPYIPSLQQKSQEKDEETAGEDYSDSDPTELFHRDMATQTSPHPSRTMSISSTDSHENPALRDATQSQTARLRSLQSTLSSLLSSQTTQFSEGRLNTTMTDFQTTLDKLETSYNPFTTNYNSNPYQVTTPNATTSTTGSGDNKITKKHTEPITEATKFRNEIRALKGAFLSSRNFPTARPAQPFTLPTR